MILAKIKGVEVGRCFEAAKKAGILFAYHNHDAEFKAIDGVVPYDLILSQTDKNKVKMELGKGVIDYKRIFEKASLSGMKYYFVEQDGAPKPLENIATSFRYLQYIVK